MIRSFLKYWLPVLLWIAIIFSASADKSSGNRSSRIIGPVVRFFVPNISEENLDTIVFTARKAAHATEYAVLSLLLWNALFNTLPSSSPRSSRREEAHSPPTPTSSPRSSRGNEAHSTPSSSPRSSRGNEAHSTNPPALSPTWRHRPAILAFILATIYAITDELHQTFVPGRTGQISDVLIDSAGAALGIALAYAAFRWGTARKHRLSPDRQLQ